MFRLRDSRWPLGRYVDGVDAAGRPGDGDALSDLDPAIVTWLGTNAKMAPEQIDRILNHESGMLGISGLSDDMRELEKAADKAMRAPRSRSRCSVIARANTSAHISPFPVNPRR